MIYYRWAQLSYILDDMKTMGLCYSWFSGEDLMGHAHGMRIGSSEQ